MSEKKVPAAQTLSVLFLYGITLSVQTISVDMQIRQLKQISDCCLMTKEQFFSYM